MNSLNNSVYTLRSFLPNKYNILPDWVHKQSTSCLIKTTNSHESVLYSMQYLFNQADDSSQIKMFINEPWSTIPPAGKMYAMENAWSPSLTRTRTTTTCTAQTARSRSPRISSPCNLLLTAHISNAHSPSNALSTIVTVTFSSRISAKNSLASCS